MRVALGEICVFNYGEALKEEDRLSGEVPVYGSNGIVGQHDRAITQGPTIIIGRKGSIGEVHYSEAPCYPIDTTYFVDSTSVPCDMIWLFYMLKALDLTGMNKSAAVPGLNRDDAYRERIPLPPLAEQRRIAAILRAADEERRRRRYTQALSDGLLGEVFVRMFGDPALPHCRLGDLLIESPKNGLYLPAEKYGTGVPIIRITDFYDGALEDAATFQRVAASPQEVREYGLSREDVLINRVNSLEYLGKCALVTGLVEPTIFESNIMRLRINAQRIMPTYLTAFLSSPEASVQILQRAKKAVNQASINQEDVSSLLIPLPVLELQREYTAIVTEHEQARRQQQESARQSDHLFETLLHRAFATLML